MQHMQCRVRGVPLRTQRPYFKPCSAIKGIESNARSEQGWFGHVGLEVSVVFGSGARLSGYGGLLPEFDLTSDKCF